MKNQLDQIKQSSWWLILLFVAISGLAFWMAGPSEENPWLNTISGLFLLSSGSSLMVKIFYTKKDSTKP